MNKIVLVADDFSFAAIKRYIAEWNHMPYQNIEDGLYVIKQKAVKNGIAIDHYGLLDIGNILEHENIDGKHPIVIHQTPPSIRLNWLKDTGMWEIVGKVIDLSGAKERLKEAIKTPGYDLLGNNCEHFARFVAFNKKYSSQLIWGAVGIVALGFLAFNLFKSLR